MADISGNGSSIELRASRTFPGGISLTSFADDADMYDAPVLAIGDAAMGPNGDLVTWSLATRLELTLNIIADTEDDENLQVLLHNNRVGRGKVSARDEITLTIVYPSGKTGTYSKGKLLSGIPSNSATSVGRFKSKPYLFVFQNYVST